MSAWFNDANDLMSTDLERDEGRGTRDGSKMGGRGSCRAKSNGEWRMVNSERQIANGEQRLANG